MVMRGALPDRQVFGYDDCVLYIPFKLSRGLMMVSKKLVSFLLLAAVAGCSSKDPNRKETVPVTGTILVNGEPASGVHVTFHPDAGIDTAQPTETKAIAGEGGVFKATTYDVGDGATLGKFKLTFTWPKLNPVSMAFSGDSLGGRYDDPDKSEYEIEVTSGNPIELGQIELKGK